jgi:hypothetical protein
MNNARTILSVLESLPDELFLRDDGMQWLDIHAHLAEVEGRNISMAIYILERDSENWPRLDALLGRDPKLDLVLLRNRQRRANKEPPST